MAEDDNQGSYKEENIDKSHHVFYLKVIEGHKFNDSADIVIGLILITCVIIGLPGNLTAMRYFWGRRKESFPDILYTIISAVDTCTCVLTIPIICTLMSKRAPLEFFENYTVCGIWYMPLNFTLRFSQFMVLIISVTRTITILSPFRSISRPAVYIACGVYAAYILIVDTVFLSIKVTKFLYFSPIASCAITNYVDPPDGRYIILVTNNLISLCLLSIVVFVSFVVSTMSMRRGSTTGNNDFRRVSITIAIFTAVFLICNLPMFVAELLNNIYFLWLKKSDVGSNSFFIWYFILLAYRVLTPVNAALNPCVYLWRMGTFRSWILNRPLHAKKMTQSKDFSVGRVGKPASLGRFKGNRSP